MWYLVTWQRANLVNGRNILLQVWNITHIPGTYKLYGCSEVIYLNLTRVHNLPWICILHVCCKDSSRKSAKQYLKHSIVQVILNLTHNLLLSCRYIYVHFAHKSFLLIVIQKCVNLIITGTVLKFSILTTISYLTPM
jgi:hypothetical protein